MTLHIKHMVCHRCVLSVAQVLHKNGIPTERVTMGALKLIHALDPEQEKTLRSDLEALGFEILDDQQSQLIEKIKISLIENVQTGDLPEVFSLVQFISTTLCHNNVTMEVSCGRTFASNSIRNNGTYNFCYNTQTISSD